VESGVSAYAAGVGLRRSTARTWSAVSHAVPLSQNVCTRGPQRVQEEDFVANSDCRVDVPANLPRPPLRRAGAQTHHCVGLWRVLGCVLFACELEVDGLSARVEDAERLGGGLRGGGTLRIVVGGSVRPN
jgi:hypothetical protein